MLGSLAILLCLIGAGATGLLAVMFARNPQAALDQTTHRLDQLPQVMADRYVAMTLLALGAAVYGDPRVIAYLFATFSLMGFVDAIIYARAGHAITKHFAAGAAALVVTLVALLAPPVGGAV